MNTDWKIKSRKLPWVCGLKTYNSDPTVYACLQSAHKLFDAIVITDDGSPAQIPRKRTDKELGSR